MHGRPRPRFPSDTDSGVDADLSGDEVRTYWRFLTLLVCCFVEERTLVFWTWAARAASLNALGAVAGAGVSVMGGFVGVGLV